MHRQILFLNQHTCTKKPTKKHKLKWPLNQEQWDGSIFSQSKRLQRGNFPNPWSSHLFLHRGKCKGENKHFTWIIMSTLNKRKSLWFSNKTLCNVLQPPTTKCFELHIEVKIQVSGIVLGSLLLDNITGITPLENQMYVLKSSTVQYWNMSLTT